MNDTVPLAETIVLQRIAEDAANDHERLRVALVGQIVSTGDRYVGYEIIEIVPPDEPAAVDDTTTLELV